MAAQSPARPPSRSMAATWPQAAEAKVQKLLRQMKFVSEEEEAARVLLRRTQEEAEADKQALRGKVMRRPPRAPHAAGATAPLTARPAPDSRARDPPARHLPGAVHCGSASRRAGAAAGGGRLSPAQGARPRHFRGRAARAMAVAELHAPSRARRRMRCSSVSRRSCAAMSQSWRRGFVLRRARCARGRAVTRHPPAVATRAAARARGCSLLRRHRRPASRRPQPARAAGRAAAVPRGARRAGQRRGA